MKKYFIMAVAVLASLTACQQNEPEATYNDGTIKFAMAQTRAGVTTTANLGTFNVYGYTEGATTLDIFPTTTTASKSGDVWTPSLTKYWAEGKTYNFFAVYAPTSTDDKIISKEVTVEDKMTIKFTNTKGNVDLVTAESLNVQSLYKNTTGNTTPLQFKHALARIAFQFQWACNTGSGMKIKVTDVKLGGTQSEGTLVVTDDKQEWTAETDVVISYDAPTTELSESEDAKLLPAINNDGTGYHYIIPTSTIEPTISFKAVVSDKEGNVIKTYNIENQKLSEASNNADVKFEPGASYHYTMNINPVFQKIEFTVSVDNWSDVNGGTINFGN